jgi:hypothetical protein
VEILSLPGRRAADLGHGSRLRWLGFERRKQLIQLVVLVGIALEMAETFLQKTGPEKKEYTKEVILAVSSE